MIPSFNIQCFIAFIFVFAINNDTHFLNLDTLIDDTGECLDKTCITSQIKHSKTKWSGHGMVGTPDRLLCSSQGKSGTNWTFDITSECHITSYHITSHHATSHQNVVSHHITSHHHITPHDITSLHFTLQWRGLLQQWSGLLQQWSGLLLHWSSLRLAST